MKSSNVFGGWQTLACGLFLLASLAAAGCTVDIGGQIHPSPWYLTDDVQYYAPGTEFKLQREAAALKAYSAEQQLQGR